MLVFGIDVLVMAMLAVVLVIASFFVSWLVQLSYEEGVMAVTATAVTSLLMLIGYVIMTKILDAIVMTL